MEVQSGLSFLVASAVQVDAYDRNEVKAPDSTASPTATTVDVQPGAAGKVQALLSRATKYGDDLKYRAHDNTTPEQTLHDALFLTRAGSLDQLEDTAALIDKLLITNTTGQEGGLEIVVGREAA